MRWLTYSYDFRFKWTATVGIGIYPTEPWLSQLVNFKNEIWTLEERYAIKFCCNFVSVSVQNGEAIIFIVGPATWHVLDEKALAILLF